MLSVAMLEGELGGMTQAQLMDACGDNFADAVPEGFEIRYEAEEVPGAQAGGAHSL